MRSFILLAGCVAALGIGAPAFAQTTPGNGGTNGSTMSRSATAPGQTGTAGTTNNSRSATAPGQTGTAGTTNNGRSSTTGTTTSSTTGTGASSAQDQLPADGGVIPH